MKCSCHVEITQQLPILPLLAVTAIGKRKSQLNASLSRLTLNRIPPCLDIGADFDVDIGGSTGCDFVD